MLQVADLCLGYDRVMVLHGVSFEARKGTLTAIVGPNGAGKSSILAAIAGGAQIASGTIRFEGRPISGLAPETIARLGLTLIPEGRHVFGSLSVEENLLVGTFMRRDRGAVKADLDRVLGYFPRIRERLLQPAGKLSGGEQQMLVIGRALMTRPRLMLIDEPSLGLAPKIVDEVYAILHRLREEEGLTILLNEQSSRRIMKFADHVIVLRDGVVQLRGSPETLGAGTALHDAYFGAGVFDQDQDNQGAGA